MLGNQPPAVTANSCYGFARKSVFQRLPGKVVFVIYLPLDILRTLIKQGGASIEEGSKTLTQTKLTSQLVICLAQLIVTLLWSYLKLVLKLIYSTKL